MTRLLRHWWDCLWAWAEDHLPDRCWSDWDDEEVS